MHSFMPRKTLAFLLLISGTPLFATRTLGRYALILQDPPAVKAMRTGGRRDALAVLSARQSIRAKQAGLRTQLRSKGFTVTGATDTLLNAVFVAADRTDVATLAALPGVRAVRFMPPAHLNLNAAVTLVDAPNAWNMLGGTGSAGAGMKIAIIDTGIDQTHPGFQDSTLAAPSGFSPSSNANGPNDSSFTTNKVIVARSYVSYLAAGTGPDPAADSRPDDYSPRDRVGHGTAVGMIAGGNTNTGPLATITGLAPHAYLGNYKVFGSPGINDFASLDGIIGAVEDAFNDGMDVAVMSLGGPALSGPLDTGPTCGLLPGEQCDPEAYAIESAVQGNMVVVAAAGNEGADSAENLPATLATVGSPAYTPDVIAVAASNNSHQFFPQVRVSGPSVPSDLQSINANYGGADFISSVFTAPGRDAATVGDQYGCSPYRAGSLFGYTALIYRGPENNNPCTFDTKVINAQTAGAVGMLIVDYADSASLVSPAADDAQIPIFVIDYNSGQTLKSYLATAGGTVDVAFDPSGVEEPDPTVNQLAYFSSRGPALANGQLKPDIAAPGTNIFTAAQDYDPNGEVYSPDRYFVGSGTSFSTPIVGGIAAMVRQKYPSLTAIEVRSALINTATSDVTDPVTGATAGVTAVGGGKAEAVNAITTSVVSVPATISFGVLSGFSSASQTLTLKNFGSSSASLSFSVSRTNADSATQLTVSPSTLSLDAGQSGSVTVTLSGSTPAVGSYEGSILITAGAVALHVPFLYVVPSGVAHDLIPLFGIFEEGTVNQSVPDQYAAFQVIDEFGIPVQNAQVSWSSTGGGSLSQQSTSTDNYGLAYAYVTLGSTPGTYNYSFKVSGLPTYAFQNYARAEPTINTGGVVNAASFTAGQGIAPGSIVSLFGTGLADDSGVAKIIPLPISINADSVSFDASDGTSVVGSLYYVSSTQVNVQVPWEITGKGSVQMKVNVDFSSGTLVTEPVVTYSPAVFSYVDSTDGQIAAALDQNNKLVGSGNPVVRGQVVQLFCNGLGPVTNQPATGAAASASPLSQTQTMPQVTIGGQSATVNFSGLAPDYAGLYQVNVVVPSGINAGVVPIALSIDNVAAPVINLPVQ